MMRSIAFIALALIAAGTGIYFAVSTPLTPPSKELGASVRASRVFALANEERSSEGVSQLSLNPLLMRAAQLKAEDMGKESYYAHVSPDGETPMHWLDAVGYKYQYVGENLTANILDEEAVVSAWMGSPGHRRNLLDPKFEHMGVGVAEGTYKGKPALFVVQMLATPKPVALPPKPKPVAVAPKPKAPIPTPPAKPIATPKPPAPAPITETKIVREVKELTGPIVEPLIGTSTARLFTSTTTDPLPLVISTSAIPIELRSDVEPGIPAGPEVMREAGKEVSMNWFRQVSEFFGNTASQIRSLIRWDS